MNKCGSCEAEIIWGVTNSGRRMPVDKEPVKEGNIRLHIRDGLPPLIRYYNAEEKQAELDKGTKCCWFISHFATCPNATWHRKK